MTVYDLSATYKRLLEQYLRANLPTGLLAANTHNTDLGTKPTLSQTAINAIQYTREIDFPQSVGGFVRASSLHFIDLFVPADKISLINTAQQQTMPALLQSFSNINIANDGLLRSFDATPETIGYTDDSPWYRLGIQVLITYEGLTNG